MSKRTAMMQKRTTKHREAAARAMDGFVRTPADLAERIVSGHVDIGNLPSGATVLEPSAGDGALVRMILDYDSDAHVLAVEPNSERADALDALAAEHPGRVTVYRQTFEEYAKDPKFLVDAVIMNPPFGDSQRADVWVEHVRLAWSKLRRGGQLVSVVPNSYPSKGAYEGLRAWVTEQGGRFENLPQGSFKASGTGAMAGLLTVPRPMEPRPDGLPLWFSRPAVGLPHPVKGRPVLTGRGAVPHPVQEYSDWSDGARPRVVRWAGCCFGCGKLVWEHDDRGDANVWEVCELTADLVGMAGPPVATCLECYHDEATNAAALAAAAPYWTDAPEAGADDQPIVYPMDLVQGQWATVAGVDYRGWDFTITGWLKADPEPVEHEKGRRILVKLVTAKGTGVDLYAKEGERVTLRDVATGVVPLEVPATPTPAEDALPEGAYGWGSVRDGKWHRTVNPRPSFTQTEKALCGIEFRPVNVMWDEPPSTIIGGECTRCVRLADPAAAAAEVDLPAIDIPPTGLPAMETVADFKRAAVAGSRWHATNHRHPKVSGLRVITGGKTVLHYDGTKADGSTFKHGRLEFPAKALVRFVGDSMHVLDGPGGKAVFTWTRLPTFVVSVDGEHVPIQATDILAAFKEARRQYPQAVVVTDTAAEVPPAGDTVEVWDVDTDEAREVSRAEAAAGMMQFARSLGPGTPAAGVAEQRAIAIASGDDAEDDADGDALAAWADLLVPAGDDRLF